VRDLISKDVTHDLPGALLGMEEPRNGVEIDPNFELDLVTWVSHGNLSIVGISLYHKIYLRKKKYRVGISS
jgi:hypothetical protein